MKDYKKKFDYSELSDELDKMLMDSDLPEEAKNFMFDLNGDVLEYTQAYENFLIDSTKDELLGFIRSFDDMMILYFESVLMDMGIDYFQAPFPLHFFNQVKGNNILERWELNVESEEE